MPDRLQRGQVYIVEFEPSRGVEMCGRRPALIVQNDRGNAYSTSTVVAAISSAPLPKIYPFTVQLSAGEAGLSRSGFVNCSQLMTIDSSRLGHLVGSLSADRMEEVDQALRYELDT